MMMVIILLDYPISANLCLYFYCSTREAYALMILLKELCAFHILVILWQIGIWSFQHFAAISG